MLNWNSGYVIVRVRSTTKIVVWACCYNCIGASSGEQKKKIKELKLKESGERKIKSLKVFNQFQVNFAKNQTHLVSTATC